MRVIDRGCQRQGGLSEKGGEVPCSNTEKILIFQYEQLKSIENHQMKTNRQQCAIRCMIGATAPELVAEVHRR